jgi:FAD:protein FMN transferase
LIEHLDGNAFPTLEIENAAVASSSGHLERRLEGGALLGPHRDGVGRRPLPTDRFAPVVAESCLAADALTRPVLARAADSAPLLQRYGASAPLNDPRFGWQHIGSR